MKKYDFLPSTAQWRAKKHPPFLQDFCKNAQWREKKLRERGSSTARPTEKGVGGLPIRSRFGRFRRVVSVDSVVSCRDLRTSSWRFVLIRSIRSSRVASKSRRKHKKKPDSLIGESGLSYRKTSRALNLLSVPLSNTRASVRGVRLGLARRSCIVMLTSDRRRIGRYI